MPSNVRQRGLSKKAPFLVENCLVTGPTSHETEEIHELYKEHVPKVMKVGGAHGKSQALAELADMVFGKATFEDVKLR